MQQIKRYKKLFIISAFSTVALFILVALIVTTNLRNNYQIKEPIIIEVSKGETDKNIFDILENAGLVEFPFLHSVAFRIIKKVKPSIFFKSGEYDITENDNYFSLINKLISGSVYHRRFTVTEGQTVAEVIKLLENNKYFSGKITKVPLEGEILPETYFYKKGTTRDEQLEIMKKSMELVIEEAWSLRVPYLPLKSKSELLILASIIEKETGHDAERERIAGVFVNRLKLGMKLQSDPTVIYAITHGKYKLERQLSKRDLLKKSPYNTYVNYSLPPAPISNPGKAAIFATVRPMETKELYFVARGDGGHRFSKTLKEHNRNVRKLRNYEKQNRENSKNTN